MIKVWLNVTIVDVDLICVACLRTLPSGSVALQDPDSRGDIVCGYACAHKRNALPEMDVEAWVPDEGIPS